MKLLEVFVTSWDKIYYLPAGDEPVAVGGYLVMNTSQGEELGKVVAEVDREVEKLDEKDEELTTFVRKATQEDIESTLEFRKKIPKTVSDCKTFVKKHDLPMKLVDAHYSIDGKRLTFAFIANGRVDFRGLLRDLVKHFKLNIRLQQIGIRDEIKINGDLGCCGKVLCCQNFYQDLGNVTSDLADLQQVAHRGSDRLSGVCGRLKCCLTYEKDVYQKMAEGLPAVGSEYKTKQGKGIVIGWHTLKRTVDVKLTDGTIIEVSL